MALPNAHRCLEALPTAPLSRTNWNRQRQLRGRHATRDWKGSELEQWASEITIFGGWVRYLVSPHTSTVILVYASPRLPKDTEQSNGPEPYALSVLRREVASSNTPVCLQKANRTKGAPASRWS